ncbi:Npt1/Npt2 family nucleotide transporter [Flavivirga amylovorans]|uniref:ADP,ATP carrier protein n=1 Tax=Flavivirga amylovorans TaxID=870486 RepID=A0ABT8X6Z8_9FLAO|nr:Npt1/Npt2 family nucleotide transporter [Flavivirga amylovorans]MDO5989761.1 Npt1/Npt2 family nucleotide transporter [Flavivirga amylovorans]
MIKTTFKKVFDIRDGELKTALLMQSYIFLIIATLLIIKPTVNSIFISDLGADSLPLAYLMVAISAIITSYIYSRATEEFSLKTIIKFTLVFSIITLLILGVLLHLNLIHGWILYTFYTGVAIYAVLATSQFWVLANMVFNIREAKRLFGFIGSGAIIGGIFGGYLTTLLAPYIGNENLIFIAVFFLFCCFPILSIIWKEKVSVLNTFKQKKRIQTTSERPFKLIRSSKHLTFLALVIGIGVITARLVDFQFSDFAAKKIKDSEELTSFFGFWLSTFNVISLCLQLFLTRKIVGVWGVGFSLILLPLIILLGALLFLVVPELWVIILLKATDGSLKQSVNRSAMELLSLPLPYQLKKQTKSFIDVVVDSVATGIAGCILIFLIKGLHVPEKFLMGFIIVLTLIWTYFVIKVRKEYFLSFRRNLDNLDAENKRKRKEVSKSSFLMGMKNVFNNGTEKEILFMLSKVKEIKDDRLAAFIRPLIAHPSHKIKAEAIRNFYFFNNESIAIEIKKLLEINDENVVLASLEYLLKHAENNETLIFDIFLDHPNKFIADVALLCLSKEARGNSTLKDKYDFSTRVEKKLSEIEFVSDQTEKETQIVKLLDIIGYGDHKEGYSLISGNLNNPNIKVRNHAIKAAGYTMHEEFIDRLLEFIEDKLYRPQIITALLNYGPAIMESLQLKIVDKNMSLSIRKLLPQVIAAFKSQQSVNVLFSVFINSDDLAIRIESLKALSNLKSEKSELAFDKNKIAKLILEECKLYDVTLNAMHTQIIMHYFKKKKLKHALSEKEIDARESLMELLERRLDAGLERIFKLLELKYSKKDIQIAYQGILSEEQEKRTNAIEFLDILLNPKLKNVLIPIVEASILDTSSEEVIEMINKNKVTEMDCFTSILKGRDLKLKLAVLYLIQQIADAKYLPILETLIENNDSKVQGFARDAMDKISSQELLK